MKTLLRSFLPFALVLPLLGEMPSLESLAQRRYVVQNGGYYSDDRTWRAVSGAGVWEWSLETGRRERLRPLGTTYMIGPQLDASISALDDRYVIHHGSMLEFDAATNRFLRRYDALAPEHGSWVFRGSAIAGATAERHGIAAGYYGTLGCPGYDPGPGCLGVFPGVGSIGYHESIRLWPLLFHRPLDPAKTQLALAKTFPADEMTSTSFDAKRGRFWFVSGKSLPSTTVTNGIIRLGYLPIANGEIGDPVVVETFEGQTPKLPRRIVYDAPTDSVLISWYPDGWLATRRPADLSAPEEQLNFWVPPFATLSGETPRRYEQVLPAIGNGPGANGSYWRSDVWFFNPSQEAMLVSVRRVGSPATTLSLRIPAHGSTELIDVLSKLGGGPVAGGGDGINTDALFIESPYRWGEQLTVYSRTYTADVGGQGTYGQSVPAVPSRHGYSNNGMFVLDRRVRGQFRHNAGIVNDDAGPLEVTLNNGTETRAITVPPHSVANMNIDDLSQPGTQDADRIMVNTSRPAPVWLSMIDNATGDGTFVPFSNYALWGALDAAMAIPQIASANGAYGTRWKSDLYGVLYDGPAMNWSESSVTLIANFYPAIPERCGGRSFIKESIPFHSTLFSDIAGQITACDSENLTGALELHTGSWTSAYSRTYTTREDGGTFGDILPLYPLGGWPVQHFSGVAVKDGFRINLGLYNGTDEAVVHRLLVYDSAGIEVARREITLGPRQSLQSPLSEFVGALPRGLYGMTVLPLDRPDRPGRSWAYVSIIDNATGDPTNLW